MNEAPAGGPAACVPPKLHHTTFTTLRLDAMVDWYGIALGLRPTFRNDRGAWLTNDEANHRIAFLALPDLQHPGDKGRTTGIHHTAFEFDAFDQWVDNYVRLRENGIRPFMSIDHGMTMSMYYQDPDGNGVEIQIDCFPSWTASKAWMASASEFAEDPIGSWFDPEKIVEARSRGVNFDEIHRRAREGGYTPEEIPTSLHLP